MAYLTKSSGPTLAMMLLAIPLLLMTSVTAFPWPQECGINYIQPDNVANATNKVMIIKIEDHSLNKYV